MAIDAGLLLPAIFFTIIAVVIASVFFNKKEAPKKKKHEEAPARTVESYQCSSEPLEIPALVNHPIFGTTVTAAAAEAKPEVAKVEEPVEEITVAEAAVVEAAQVSVSASLRGGVRVSKLDSKTGCSNP